jgi:hypothetical protein
MSDQQVLNLDDLFGQSKAIKVQHEGKTYELLHPEGLDPVQLNQWERLRRRSSLLKQAGDELTDEQADELTQVTLESLRLLNPELAEQGLSFIKQVRVLKFYSEQVAPADEKKMTVRES